MTRDSSSVLEQSPEQAHTSETSVSAAPVAKMVNAPKSTRKTPRPSVVDTIRANPVPAVVAVVGLGWLVVSGLKGSKASTPRRGDGHGASPDGLLARGQRAVGDTVDKARTVAGDVAGSVQDTAGRWAGAAHDRAHRVGGRVQDVTNDNPLAVGAAALAIGAVVGFAIPQTRRENELMGEARETLVDRAQTLASDALEHVREAADRVAEGGDDSAPSNEPQAT